MACRSQQSPGTSPQQGLSCYLYVFNLALRMRWRNAVFSQALQVKCNGFPDELLYFLRG